MIKSARCIAEQMNIHTKDAETFLTAFKDIVGDSLASVRLYVSLASAPSASGMSRHIRAGTRKRVSW